MTTSRSLYYRAVHAWNAWHPARVPRTNWDAFSELGWLAKQKQSVRPNRQMSRKSGKDVKRKKVSTWLCSKWNLKKFPLSSFAASKSRRAVLYGQIVKLQAWKFFVDFLKLLFRNRRLRSLSFEKFTFELNPIYNRAEFISPFPKKERACSGGDQNVRLQVDQTKI